MVRVYNRVRVRVGVRGSVEGSAANSTGRGRAAQNIHASESGYGVGVGVTSIASAALVLPRLLAICSAVSLFYIRSGKRGRDDICEKPTNTRHIMIHEDRLLFGVKEWC